MAQRPISQPTFTYYSYVTLTTLGYGDITPQTDVGQILSAFIMLLGYGIIAVPTGIISAEFVLTSKGKKRACPYCKVNLPQMAKYCANCGKKIEN